MSGRAARWLAAAGVASLLLVLGAVAEGRPGGGHSYSGGGGGGSGGDGGDGGGAIVELLFYLIFYYPELGIPVAIAVVIGYIWVKRQKRGLTNWDSGPPVTLGPAIDLDALRRLDPEFSVVLFEDFVYRLYAQAHVARSQEASLAALAPYINGEARAQLAGRPPAGARVSNVVIGAMRVIRLDIPGRARAIDGRPGYVSVTLEFEANLTTTAAAQQRTEYVVERWTLNRAASVQSKPPGATTNFPCPNCGAPFAATESQVCSYCDQVVDNGRFDWLVTAVYLTHRTDGPPALTASVPERGTDLPTVIHHAMATRWNQLTADDPALHRDDLAARLELIYHELNAAWSARDLTPVRPFVSDGMYNYLAYWISAYHQQGLRNVLERMQITNWTLAKITRDRHFDAATVRLWATGRDYTVESGPKANEVANEAVGKAAGKVVAGSSHRDRAYSEYWTLIRAANTRGAARADRACPNCGAALDRVNMAGTCEYCGSHITSGEFDWVLSKIEQDDSYRG